MSGKSHKRLRQALRRGIKEQGVNTLPRVYNETKAKRYLADTSDSGSEVYTTHTAVLHPQSQRAMLKRLKAARREHGSVLPVN